MNDTKFYKSLLFINALVPLGLLAFDGFRGELGANPIEFVTSTTGFLTLIFLFIGLAITPLRKWLKINDLIKYRRMVGLFAFFYGVLHFITYVWFDRELNLAKTAGDIWQRPFIAIGMLSFFLLIPLAVTSTNSMIKRLGGKNWQQLHKLVYVAAIGGVIHFYMIVKSDLTLPLTFAAVLAVLLGYRIYTANQKAFASQNSVVPK
ncbi:MAG: sulfoxide reductase heme-binding subunit YedZ [Pyrinomonadaceae bacterium]|nr:sulfoxide reductase heme-binding subunit YedZ [Pyrinomonadaceae bacterium]